MQRGCIEDESCNGESRDSTNGAAEIGDGLESLQKAVGGLIDCAYPWREKVCIVCNDEGLINGMPMNRAVERYGALAGPFFICGISGENFAV